MQSASLLDQFSLLDIVDIATDTGEAPTDVAPLYFLLSEKFGIDAMLTRVTSLPRDDRWDALARGALRDDLYAVLESLTRSVIDASTSGADAGGTATRSGPRPTPRRLTRAKTALSGIERLDKPNIAALSVALRTLRSVIRSGAAAAHVVTGCQGQGVGRRVPRRRRPTTERQEAEHHQQAPHPGARLLGEPDVAPRELVQGRGVPDLDDLTGRDGGVEGGLPVGAASTGPPCRGGSVPA